MGVGREAERGWASQRLRPQHGEGERKDQSLFWSSGLCLRWGSPCPLWRRGRLAFPSPKPEGPLPLPWARVGVHVCVGG